MAGRESFQIKNASPPPRENQKIKSESSPEVPSPHHKFVRVSAAPAASLAATNPSVKEAALRAASTKGGGRLRRPPPFVDSFMDGCVGAGEAAGAAETHVNVRKTCTCMHTLRATSYSHGHHGHAQPAGRAGKMFLCVMKITKRTRSARAIILLAISACLLYTSPSPRDRG